MTRVTRRLCRNCAHLQIAHHEKHFYCAMAVEKNIGGDLAMLRSADHVFGIETCGTSGDWFVPQAGAREDGLIEQMLPLTRGNEKMQDMDIGLDTISRTVQSWLDWQTREWAAEGKEPASDTHVWRFPVNPTRAMLENWIKLFVEIRSHIERERQ